MAKCVHCGRKKLFQKLNARGLCNACAAISLRESEIKQMEARAAKEAARIKQRAQDAEALLSEALIAAKTEAHRQLELQEAQTAKNLHELRIQVDQEQTHCAELTALNEKLSKQQKTAENRINKDASIYRSMRYAMSSFMDPQNSLDTLKSIFNTGLEDGIKEMPDLKCLSMKSLRSLFKQNEKKIQKVTEDYQGLYTTKANATIYKLMVMALNAELMLILQGLSYGKLEQGIDRVKGITQRYYVIASEGNQTIVNTLVRFIGEIEYLYIEAVKIEYEYYVQRERAKEEQRAIREQMRQEAEERKQLELQRKQVENEEKKYQQEMERLKQQIEISNEQNEIEKLKDRIKELTGQMQLVNEKKEEIIHLQNGKAGTVYIISNIGSFGEDVFKIGMTRRLEPQERVNELGDASVPFPFDVHSFIFSEDAVALENILHKELNDRRVNKVNLRREFFNISLDELEKLVERIDPNAPFQRTVLAEQYHQSLSIDKPMEACIDIDDDHDEE